MTVRHVVAMGGGGFSMEPSPLLDDYVLGLVSRDRPKLLFVPTASGDSADYAVRFYRAFDGRAETRVLDLFRVDGPADRIAWADVVYVGGGNTANMMAIWKLHGVDRMLRDAYRRGTVMAGISAGAVCWFESGVTDSFGPPLRGLTGCLGLLSGSFCPHYDGEVERRPTYRRLVDSGELAPGYGVDDSCAIHFENEEIAAVVRSRETATAYRVDPGVETELARGSRTTAADDRN